MALVPIGIEHLYDASINSAICLVLLILMTSVGCKSAPGFISFSFLEIKGNFAFVKSFHF